MILAEQPVAVFEDLMALLLRLGVAPLQADHPRQPVAGGQGIRVIVA